MITGIWGKPRVLGALLLGSLLLSGAGCGSRRADTSVNPQLPSPPVICYCDGSAVRWYAPETGARGVLWQPKKGRKAALLYISPSGRLLAVQLNPGEAPTRLGVVSLPDGAVRWKASVSGFGAAFSSDDKTIAFLQFDRDDTIWLVVADAWSGRTLWRYHLPKGVLPRCSVGRTLDGGFVFVVRAIRSTGGGTALVANPPWGRTGTEVLLDLLGRGNPRQVVPLPDGRIAILATDALGSGGCVVWLLSKRDGGWECGRTELACPTGERVWRWTAGPQAIVAANVGNEDAPQRVVFWNARVPSQVSQVASITSMPRGWSSHGGWLAFDSANGAWSMMVARWPDLSAPTKVATLPQTVYLTGIWWPHGYWPTTDELLAPASPGHNGPGETPSAAPEPGG